ncbi:MAG: SdrD B-like domain-containing protein, partial [Thermoguttaceae bacterium]
YEIGRDNAILFDRYSDPADVGLNLPADGYNSVPSREIQTAAGVGHFIQVPKKGSLSGFVYEDYSDTEIKENNNNGIKDTGEKGIAGVQLSLWKWDGTKYVEIGKIATTNDEGFYIFNNLDADSIYKITEWQPDGYIDGKDAAGSLGGIADNPGDTIRDIPVGPNQHGTNYNFGELKTGSLSGHVYEDDNCNGVLENGEKGIPDIELTLWVWDGTKYVKTGDSTITNEHGFYEFINLDPFKKYQITETQPPHEQPPHYFEGKEQVGSLGGIALSPPENTITEIFVGADKHGINYNFAERLPGVLSGFVYEDINDNGKQESNEPGIAGVELTLYIWNAEQGKYVTTNRTVKTGENGSYRFDDLDPCQKYGVKEKQPSNYLDGKDTPGPGGGKVEENDFITEIPVKPGKDAIENNFGERKPSSLSGYVFQDGDTVHLYPNDPDPNVAPPNWNGNINNATKRLKGVILVLADANGNPLKDANGNLITAVTDENGFYEFNMLEEGTYSVIEHQPGGYIDGIDTPGTT